MGFRLAILLASVTLLTSAQTTQTTPTLASLAVPERDLPSGCRLEPTPPDTASRADMVRAQLVMGRAVFPANPWSGNDRRLLLALRELIDGPLTTPDAPAPTRGDISAMEQRYIADVREGYHAIYRSDKSRVRIAALTFSDAHDPRIDPRLEKAMSSRLSERIVKGRRVVVVESDVRSECFDKIVEHARK